MAPLPPNVTARWYVDYSWQYGSHTLEIRTPAPADVAASVAEIRGFLTTFAGLCYSTWKTTRLRYSAVGSNLSFPVAMTPVTGSAPADPGPASAPRFISFTGRGPAGRRVRITCFGVAHEVTEDYRLQEDLPTALQNALTYLKDPARMFVTIGGDRPVWNDYVNTGFNAYFQRKNRRVY